MKKKFRWLLGMFLFPFIAVWGSYILTGLSFSPQSVFQSGGFWGLSIMYWFLWLVLGAHMLDDKDF